MNALARPLTLLALSGLFGVAVPVSVAAQLSSPPRQVVSANPFGIMLEIFNAEYERQAGESYTIGVGGSVFTSNSLHYANLDAFWRFYPEVSAEPFNGWSFGLKAGLTGVDSHTYLGAGFDVDRSWLLGKRNNFYVGVGFGLKRLFGKDTGLQFIPTIRLVNIGVAF